jgi:hypothetical protein
VRGTGLAGYVPAHPQVGGPWAHRQDLGLEDVGLVVGDGDDLAHDELGGGRAVHGAAAGAGEPAQVDPQHGHRRGHRAPLVDWRRRRAVPSRSSVIARIASALGFV